MDDKVTPLRRGPTAQQLWESPRGRYIVARALEMAIAYIDAMPPEDRSMSDRADMKLFLDELFGDQLVPPAS